MIDNFSLSDPATKPAAALMAEEHWWINVDSTSPPGVPDPLLSVVRAAGKRQQHIVKALAKENLTFGSKNAYSGVMDAFHGEMPFGMAPSAKRADGAIPKRMCSSPNLTTIERSPAAGIVISANTPSTMKQIPITGTILTEKMPAVTTAVP